MNLQQAILRDADRCVLCGMCLPHCPTYLRTGNEAESPRGRISLMLALARGQLAATPALVAHLDACLACRACETTCPSEVHYGRLLGNARRLVAPQRRAAWRARLLAALTSRAGLLRGAVRLARTRGGRTALELLGLRTIGSLLARKVGKVPTNAPLSPPRGKVALFAGCTGEALDAETLAAAETLLQAAGFSVEIPEGQTCCGALHHHLGDAHAFEQRAAVNLEAFPAARFDTIVFIASGCGAMLKEYGEWLDTAPAREFAARCLEITDFLARNGFPEAIRFRALPETVAVHLPCTQRNVLKSAGATERLLKQIPGIALVSLPENSICCGAAGSHMLSRPSVAHALREPKLEALERSGARHLVTTNVGCALHLAAGAQARAMTVEVLHPIALLARQLPAPPAHGLAADSDPD